MRCLTETNICKGRGACFECRSTGAIGEKWRASVGQHFSIPVRCPWGVPINGTAKDARDYTGPTPAEIEAKLAAEGYDGKRDLHKGGCNCGGLADTPQKREE